MRDSSHEIRFFFVCLILAPTLSYAKKELTEIYVSPNAISALPFYNKIKAKSRDGRIGSSKPKQHYDKKRPRTLYDALPVSTPNLTVGYQSSIKWNKPEYTPPVFIIGYDQASIDWLLKYKETLLKGNAVGFVVNVQSKEQFDYIVSLAKGLDIYPRSGEPFYRIGIRHYPALISQFGVEQ